MQQVTVSGVLPHLADFLTLQVYYDLVDQSLKRSGARTKLYYYVVIDLLQVVAEDARVQGFWEPRPGCPVFLF